MPLQIHGNEYVTVAERIAAFHQETGSTERSITTELLTSPDAEECWVKATVRIGGCTFTGHSQAAWNDAASMVNKTAALENAETSAVGRALGFAGFGVTSGVASADEVLKADAQTPRVERKPVEANAFDLYSKELKAAQTQISLDAVRNSIEANRAKLSPKMYSVLEVIYGERKEIIAAAAAQKEIPF